MPIYAYRCEECGFSKDVLQKISDPVLTVCPSCAKPSFKKQVTAAGFQLKGSGWYVTDFRGGTPPATGTAAGTGGADAGAAAAPAAAAAPTTPAPAAPATGSSNGGNSGGNSGSSTSSGGDKSST
ncbi:zinc ribbon domain-containing protein [Oxalobacteraceae sp. CFBP 13730]|nr:zinc ribbon domain-containing protein [Oxalobacteraceae sp. CFBP 13730]